MQRFYLTCNLRTIALSAHDKPIVSFGLNFRLNGSQLAKMEKSIPHMSLS